MVEVTGDLWTYRLPDGSKPDIRVITTNGTIKNNGECVMGRGCAAEANARYPGLAKGLGYAISISGNRAFLLPLPNSSENILTFPVKHNWFNKADLVLIANSAKDLVVYADYWLWKVIVLPRPGCGNGHLDWKDVKLVLAPILDDRFHVITFA